MRDKGKKLLAAMLAVIIFAAGVTGSYIIEVYAADTFEESISRFPDSYKAKLRQLHKKYPKWVFEPLETGLDWNTVVASETDPIVVGKGNKSLVTKNASNMLKRNESSDYNVVTGQYIYKDSTSWVSANSNTVAYFLDPRNFLDEKNIMQFEKNSFDKRVHTLSGVNKILQNTYMDSAKGNISYLNTKGKTQTTTTTYAQEIYSAGQNSGVSPYYLASKIRQEVGGYSVPSGSVSGNYTSKDGKTKFVGYYNFYNIGANDGADPISNGLNFAMKSDVATQRPWNTPMKSIGGGAVFFYNNYIKSYQNTGYLVRFNVDKRSNYPLYTHQYMTNISGAASEGIFSYNGYVSLGYLSDAKVFLIPVYKNMPNMSNKIIITSAKSKTGTVNGSLNVRSGPGLNYGTVTTLKHNAQVTILEGQRADTGYNSSSLTYPYWYKISYKVNGKDTTGYVYCEFLETAVKKNLAKGEQYPIPTSRTTASDKVYYLSDDPAILTVNENGIVTAKKEGEATVYAFLASGKMDSIKIRVENFTLSHSQKKLYTGSSFTLKAQLASNNTVKSWVSNNTKTAIVDSKGKVSAKQPGKAVITVETTNGSKKQCEITVLPSKTVVSIKNYSYNFIKLKWKKSAYADGYQIYRTDAGKSSYKKIAAIKNQNTIEYADYAVSKDKQYEYRIRSYKKVNGVTYHSGYTYINGKASLKPVTVGSLQNKSRKTATLKWKKISKMSGYAIYRRDQTTNKYKKIKTIKGNATFQFTDRNLKKGRKYFYRIKAYKTIKGKASYSGFSKTTSIVIRK